MKKNPNIIFLGVCEKIKHITPGQITHSTNIIGLKNSILTYVLPFNLKGTKLLFAGTHLLGNDDVGFSLIDSKKEEIMKIRLSKEEVKNVQKKENTINPTGGKNVFPIDKKNPTWIIFDFMIPTDTIVTNPGNIFVERIYKSKKQKIGNFRVIPLNAPPLSPERIAAIKSDPNAAKTIKMDIGCRLCKDNQTIYTGLERDEKIEKEGAIWYTEAPKFFKCKCGKTTVDLKFIRENLHGVLGHRKAMEGISINELYSKEALADVTRNFYKLLESEHTENEIQKFIEENLVILKMFNPTLTFLKSNILGKFQTDFAILNNQNELLLIEIEKASTPLIKKDGGMHSKLQKAFDQLRDWLHEAREERSAVIKAVGLRPDEVTLVKGIVIAGRDRKYDSEKLRKLKASLSRGEISFYTYDDLVESLRILQTTIDKI